MHTVIFLQKTVFQLCLTMTVFPLCFHCVSLCFSETQFFEKNHCHVVSTTGSTALPDLSNPVSTLVVTATASLIEYLHS